MVKPPKKFGIVNDSSPAVTRAKSSEQLVPCLVICFFFCMVSSNSCELTLSSEDTFFVILVFNIFLVMIIILNINMNFWSCSWASQGTFGGQFKRARWFSGKTADQKLSCTIDNVWWNEISYHQLSWRIWTSSNWMIVHDSWWSNGSTRFNYHGPLSTIIDYNGPFDQGLKQEMSVYLGKLLTHERVSFRGG